MGSLAGNSVAGGPVPRLHEKKRLSRDREIVRRTDRPHHNRDKVDPGHHALCRQLMAHVAQGELHGSCAMARVTGWLLIGL